MERPAPDPAKLLAYWDEWERGRHHAGAGDGQPQDRGPPRSAARARGPAVAEGVSDQPEPEPPPGRGADHPPSRRRGSSAHAAPWAGGVAPATHRPRRPGRHDRGAGPGPPDGRRVPARPALGGARGAVPRRARCRGGAHPPLADPEQPQGRDQLPRRSPRSRRDARGGGPARGPRGGGPRPGPGDRRRRAGPHRHHGQPQPHRPGRRDADRAPGAAGVGRRGRSHPHRAARRPPRRRGLPRGALGQPPLDRAIHFFELEDETVWGATGRIMVQLLSIATGVAP